MYNTITTIEVNGAQFRGGSTRGQSRKDAEADSQNTGGSLIVDSVYPGSAKPTVEIFYCYCGDNFFNSASYAKHYVLHASGEFKPREGEGGSDGEIYLRSGAGGNVDDAKINISVDRKAKKSLGTHGKALSVSSSSSGTFFTAPTNNGTL